MNQENIGDYVRVVSIEQVKGRQGLNALALHVEMITARELFANVTSFQVLDVYRKPGYTPNYIALRCPEFPLDTFFTTEDNIIL